MQHHEHKNLLLPLIAKLAKDMGLGVIDMHTALESTPELLPDHVHPNAVGAGKMAEAAFTVLTCKEGRGVIMLG